LIKNIKLSSEDVCPVVGYLHSDILLMLTVSKHVN